MRFTPNITTIRTLAPADTTRGAQADPVAEIVTFRLTPNADPSGFAKAAGAMTPFLENTKAVVSRTLSQDETGLWTDHIIWTSMRAAQSAAKQIMEEPAAAPFMQMIDPETVDMRHAPIRFSIALE